MKSWAISNFSLRKRKGSVSKTIFMWHSPAILCRYLSYPCSRASAVVAAYFQVICNASSMPVRTHVLSLNKCKYASYTMWCRNTWKNCWWFVDLWRELTSSKPFCRSLWLIIQSVYLFFCVPPLWRARKPRWKIKGSWIQWVHFCKV